MALKKSEKKLLVILGVAVLIFIVDKFVLGGDKKKKPAPPPNKAAATAVAKKAPAPSTAASAPVRRLPVNTAALEFDSWGRDPFNKVITATDQAASATRSLQRKHELRGILWREGRVFALIDDMVLTEGEEKEGLRLNRIQGQQAYCSIGGRTFTLQLKEK